MYVRQGLRFYLFLDSKKYTAQDNNTDCHYRDRPATFKCTFYTANNTDPIDNISRNLQPVHKYRLYGTIVYRLTALYI